MKKIIITILLLFFGAQLTFAQEKIISGVVTSSEDGLTIPGVTILIKGTLTGVTTDVNGSYKLTVPNDAAILVFSFIGYNKYEVAVKSQTVINVSMEPSLTTLDEVVVVAYGTTTKKSFTGSAAVVKSELFDRIPVSSFEKALVGTVAGVQISNGSGQPGSSTEISIRGRGSFSASNSPLYVIDGVPVVSGSIQGGNGGATPGNLMSTIPTGDIESVTVLKDAAAASLYGSRAANGVILITTKQGKKGVTKYRFKSSIGISDFAYDNLEPVSGEEHIMLNKEALENKYGVGHASVEYYMNKYQFHEPEAGFTDWRDLFFRKGITKNIEFSATGGSDKTKFYISANMFDQEGLALTSDLKRYSGRINVTHEISKTLKIGVNIFNSSTVQNIVDAGTRYFNPFYNVSRNTWPTESPYDKNGELKWSLITGYYNYARESKYNTNVANIFRTMNTAFIEYKPFDFLTFRSTNSYDWVNNDEVRYASPESRTGRKKGGYVRNTNRKNIQKTTSNLLTFDKIFNEFHHVNIIGAFEAEKSIRSAYSATGEKLPNESLTSIGVTSLPTRASGYENPSTMISYLSRVNYAYDNKYYFSASIRRDGSSKLGVNKRWANFWSVSGAWRITQEKFMDNISFVDDLKLKASYGTNGTLPPNLYEHLALYTYTGAYGGSPAATENQIDNSDLNWEKNKTFNIGFEFAVFKKVRGSIEYFTRNTTDLLMSLPVPLTTGFSSTWKNIGEMSNKGIEIELHINNVNTKDFKWTTSFTFTSIKNKITNLYKHEDIISRRYIRSEGEAYHSFYMPVWAGVDPADGTPTWHIVDDNGNITDEITHTYSEAKPAIVGKADPDFYGSFGNNFSYKGFNFSFLFNFSVGGKLFAYPGGGCWGDGIRYKYVIHRDQLDRWQKPGDIARFPQRIWNGNNRSYAYSSRLILDNDFLRLKNIMLSYDLPKSLLKSLNFKGVTVYVQGTNLLTWASQDYADPEQRSNGYINFEMPNVKTFTLGIEVGF